MANEQRLRLTTDSTAQQRHRPRVFVDVLLRLLIQQDVDVVGRLIRRTILRDGERAWARLILSEQAAD